jgi:catechol 2,3-dioxygenase-like lactoylglutathione lyase family enzyme
MLSDIDATPMLAVKDLATARAFYEGVLGLDLTMTEPPGTVRYRSGKASIVVYESEYAGTNQANALAWSAGDGFDRLMAGLTASGVSFEHYELPGLTRIGDIHTADGFKGVWFKDPDGNILHINGR